MNEYKLLLYRLLNVFLDDIGASTIAAYIFDLVPFIVIDCALSGIRVECALELAITEHGT
ncbi:hypothetical protein HAX54_015044, partial [Datura stramonium]|nr:hypothetical protein [Datura stramonium]